MAYMSQEKFESSMRRIKLENKSNKRKQRLKEEKKKYGFNFKLPSVSKLILIVAVLICLQILIFCEYMIVQTRDTSALYAMVGIVATLIPIIWGYFSKSKAENTSGGIVYETAMMQMNQQANNLLNNPNGPESDSEAKG